MPLYALLVALVFVHAHSQCYLEDASATCAVCWKTVSGVTTASTCPTGIAIQWDIPLPESLEEGTGYAAEYSLIIDTSLDLKIKPKVTKGTTYEVSHSNIHSCVKSRGACTPFVGNSPGLSTHTSNTPGNFTLDGNRYVNKFRTNVELPVESYIVIAHTRLFTKSDEKYDIVVGVPRDVIPQPAVPSTDAYISAAIVGVVIILLLGSVVWASRTGKLDLDLILLALTREEVGYMTEIVISAGDMIAFTVGVKQDVIDSDEMQDMVPICVVFLVVGWFAALVCIRKASSSLYNLVEAHYRPESHYQKKIARKSVKDLVFSPTGNSNTEGDLSASTIEELRGEKQSVKTTKQSFRTLGSFISTNKSVFQQYDRAKRQLHGQYINVLTMTLADLPMAVIGVYILAKADSTEFAVIIALVGSAMLLGKKGSDLGRFSKQAKEMELAKKAVRDIAKSEAEKESSIEKGLGQFVVPEPPDIPKNAIESGDESSFVSPPPKETKTPQATPVARP